MGKHLCRAKEICSLQVILKREGRGGESLANSGYSIEKKFVDEFRWFQISDDSYKPYVLFQAMSIDISVMHKHNPAIKTGSNHDTKLTRERFNVEAENRNPFVFQNKCYILHTNGTWQVLFFLWTGPSTMCTA